MAKQPKQVRYRVLGPAFVNGSLIDPQGRKDVFVMAAPGLEGKNLQLAPEVAVADEGKQDSQGQQTSPAK